MCHQQPLNGFLCESPCMNFSMKTESKATLTNASLEMESINHQQITGSENNKESNKNSACKEKKSVFNFSLC